MDYVFLLNAATQIDACTGTLARIMGLVNSVMTVIYIAVPIILILMGSIDLIKAILQSDDKKMKEAQGMLWKRLMYGALIFFLGLIIQFVIFEIIQPGGVTSSCWNRMNAEINPRT